MSAARAQPPAPSDQPAPETLNLNRPRAWWIGSVLLLGLIVLVQVWIGWPQLLAPWLAFPPWLLLGLLALSAGSYLARARRVSVYFAPLMTGRFPTTLRLSVLHTTANLFLPMRLRRKTWLATSIATAKESISQ